MSLERKLARGFVKSLNQMERTRVRNANQKERERVKRLRQMERELAKSEKEKAKYEKQQYIQSRKNKVSLKNEILEAKLAALESILRDTLEVDDYFDLNELKKTEKSNPYINEALQTPAPTPESPTLPPKPQFVEPKLPFTIFGRKQKKEDLLQSETLRHDQALKNWEIDIEKIKNDHAEAKEKYQRDEEQRIAKLASEIELHKKKLEDHNTQIDQFINFLAYGDKSAVEDYISIVMENSVYPDDLKVKSKVEFEPSLAELSVQIKIPPASKLDSTKSFKYVQSRDEITSTEISQTEKKRRYTSLMSQVVLRTAHEVFEADRGSIINSVSIELGTKTTDPATGKMRFITLAGLSCQRSEFEKINLSKVDPVATMKHFKATISKSPLELLEVDLSGVRKSK